MDLNYMMMFKDGINVQVSSVLLKLVHTLLLQLRLHSMEVNSQSLELTLEMEL